MAAKALLYSPDKLTFEKRKVTACESLVMQLLAVKLAHHVYQRLKVNSARLPGNLKQSCTSKRIIYIPERLPSHKTPGTKAIGPVVERSRTGVFRIMQANHLSRIQASQ